MSRFEIAPGALRSYHWGRNDQRGAVFQPKVKIFFANWLYQGDKGTKFGWPWGQVRLERLVVERDLIGVLCWESYWEPKYWYVWILCVYTVYSIQVYITYILQLEPTANLLKLPYFKGVFVSFIVEHTTYSNTSSLTQKYGWNPEATPQKVENLRRGCARGSLQEYHQFDDASTSGDSRVWPTWESDKPLMDHKPVGIDKKPFGKLDEIFINDCISTGAGFVLFC